MTREVRFVFAAVALLLSCRQVSAQCTDSAWQVLDDSSSWWRIERVDAMTAWDRDQEGPDPAMLTAAGMFTAPSGEERTSIGAWTGSQWQLLGAPVQSVGLLGITSLEVYRGELYAGGDQTFSPGVRNLARWNGTEWARVGNGSTGRVFSIKEYRDKLYIGSEFGWPRVWDGLSFSYIPLDGMTVGGASPRITAFCEHRGQLIIAGSFILSPPSGQGDPRARNIIAWDGVSLQLLSDGINDGPTYYDNFRIVSNGEQLMVASDFWHYNSGQWHPYNVLHILGWDGERWSPRDEGSGGYPMTLLAYEGRVQQFSRRVVTPPTASGLMGAQWIGASWLEVPLPSIIPPLPGTIDFFNWLNSAVVLDNTMIVGEWRTPPSVGVIHTKRPCRTCTADVDDGSGLGVPDRSVGIDDLLHYLGTFEQGRMSADIDDGSASGRRDDVVTVNDLVYYLSRFEAGC